MSWVRLSEYSDWGVRYLARPGEGLSANGGASAARAIKLPPSVRVRWRDGVEEDVRLEKRHFKDVVSDQGSRYEVVSQLPVIVVDHHGHELWVPLTDVEIWLP